MANINFHESYPKNAVSFTTWGVGSLPVNGFYLGTTLPFVSVAMLWSASGTTAKTLSVSFGLFSMNGGTLSLANSASGSVAPTANAISWMTLVTSATMNLSAGNWYTAMMYSTAGNSRISILVRDRALAGTISPNWVTVRPGGQYIYGGGSASTAVMPGSLATSNTAQNSAVLIRHPYVIISG